MIVDLEPLVEARRLLSANVGVDEIRERLRHEYALERAESEAVVVAARSWVQYEAKYQDW